MPRNPFRETEQERSLDRDARDRASGRDRDRDDRPSWREIDKVRDRSPHSDQAREAPARSSPAGRREAEAVRKSAAASLDALFTPAEPASVAAERRLLQASTRGEREAALLAHEAAHGFPRGWDVLVHLVDVRDEALCARVMAALAAGAPERAPAEREAAVAAVRERAFTLASPEARGVARAVVQACRT